MSLQTAINQIGNLRSEAQAEMWEEESGTPPHALAQARIEELDRVLEILAPFAEQVHTVGKYLADHPHSLALYQDGSRVMTCERTWRCLTPECLSLPVTIDHLSETTDRLFYVMPQGAEVRVLVTHDGMMPTGASWPYDGIWTQGARR